VLNYFPKFFTSKAISLYFIALLVCNIIFFNHALSFQWWIFGIVEVVAFFYFANENTRKWSSFSEKKFIRTVFVTAIILRIIWVVFSYFYYTAMTGQPFEFDAGDAMGYHAEGTRVAALITNGQLQVFFDRMKDNYSDMGYGLYLGFEYMITNSSIIIERLLKAFYGAFTCVLIYRLAKRTFGEEAARMAAIFCMLMPNLILYTGLHLKEIEMVLLSIWYLERADFLLRSKKLNFQVIFPVLLLGGSLFFFRTVLGASALFALFTALMFSSEHVLNMGKRAILIVWLIGTASFFVGGRIANEVEEVWKAREANQSISMELRTTQLNGNKYAKKMGAAVFAPMIFAIPFPTVVETPNQQNQKIINGGNFVKNVLAFFVLFSFVMIIREKKWRDYLLVGSFTIGYLLVLSFSAFAQSERFHQPVLPLELMLAAFGITLVTNKTKKYYKWWMILLFFVILGWSWFKLAGRDMV